MKKLIITTVIIVTTLLSVAANAALTDDNVDAMNKYLESMQGMRVSSELSVRNMMMFKMDRNVLFRSDYIMQGTKPEAERVFRQMTKNKVNICEIEASVFLAEPNVDKVNLSYTYLSAEDGQVTKLFLTCE